MEQLVAVSKRKYFRQKCVLCLCILWGQWSVWQCSKAIEQLRHLNATSNCYWSVCYGVY